MRVNTRIVPSVPYAGPPPLPKTTTAWLTLVVLALSLLAVGGYCFTQQTLQGFIATGLRNPGYGAGAWGLYIAFDVFFIGVSFAGITVAALCRLFDIEALRPITRMAELLTITALIAGACVVIADLGRPDHGLLKLPRFANPSSPFYGTFTLVVAGYMFSSLVYFFLAGRADAAALASDPKTPGRLFYRIWASGYRDLPAQRARHHRVSFWLALTILPLLVTAHSTLGFIFGIQGGRPGWYSALQAPAFVVLAGVSGTGMLILMVLGFRRLFALHDKIPDKSIRWLGNFMWILALVYLYFMVVEELTASYAGPEADRHLAHEVVGGAFAPIFWTVAGCLFLTFAIPFLQYVRGKTSVRWVGIAGLLANVAAVGKRFLIVVPSQTHGALMPVEPPRAYEPTWVEYGLIAGLFGLIILAMLLFGRFFPLVPSPHPHGEARKSREFKRRGIAFLVMLVALGLIVFGLADSFRMLRPNEVDPMVPYAPVIFAAGVMLLFISAIVYEVLPERKPTPREEWRADQERRAAALAGRAPLIHPISNASRLNHLDIGKIVRATTAAEIAARHGDTARAEAQLNEAETLLSKLIRRGS
ncbi:MAG: polysulfide reductase NrfD [Deltaproteobacteria bacterium]|nr:polysulfide reductase NrfD [Deltaproteobacteria bacterium]